MKHQNYNKTMKKIKAEEETKTVYCLITEEEYWKLWGYLDKRRIRMKDWVKEMIRKIP